jgi:hypothetical protein
VKAKQRMRMDGVIALSIVLIYLYFFWLDWDVSSGATKTYCHH